MTICKPGGESSLDTKSAGALTLSFSAARTVINKFLLFKSQPPELRTLNPLKYDFPLASSYPESKQTMLLLQFEELLELQEHDPAKIKQQK